jgi:hypothetical protein
LFGYLFLRKCNFIFLVVNGQKLILIPPPRLLGFFETIYLVFRNLEIN